MAEIGSDQLDIVLAAKAEGRQLLWVAAEQDIFVVGVDCQKFADKFNGVAANAVLFPRHPHVNPDSHRMD